MDEHFDDDAKAETLALDTMTEKAGIGLFAGGWLLRVYVLRHSGLYISIPSNDLSVGAGQGLCYASTIQAMIDA